MRVIDGVIGALWIAFWVYWMASAVGVKAGRGRSRGFVGARVALVLVVVVLIRGGVLGKHAVIRNRALGLVGLAVVVLGLALAIWARRYLGRNWGMPMTQKVDPELVTSGPYRTIRHPIYTGIMLGMVGTAIAVSPYVLIPVVVVGAYFVYSADGGAVHERPVPGQLSGVPARDEDADPVHLLRPTDQCAAVCSRATYRSR